MTETKHMDIKLDLKELTEDGSFEGYGSVFGVLDSDSEMDVLVAAEKEFPVNFIGDDKGVIVDNDAGRLCQFLFSPDPADRVLP